MKIGVIDADLIGRKKHRMPNLASMKISGYWKDNGADVKLLLDYDWFENKDEFDHVYISKVFTDTPIPDFVTEIYNGTAHYDNIEIGGTGFYYDNAPFLPDEIEHHMPDYHLYDEWIQKRLDNGEKPVKLKWYTDYSIGYTTRGCIRGCSFCVNKHYKQCVLHSPISEFYDKNKKYICLLDDNLFACKDWEKIFEELWVYNKRVTFRQGLDERLLSEKKLDVMFKTKIFGDWIFAFDNLKDAPIIERKLQMIRERSKTKSLKFYTFCRYDHEHPDESAENYPDEFWLQDIVNLLERIVILMKYNSLPYIMKHKNWEKAPEKYKGMYSALTSWCNAPIVFRKKSLHEQQMLYNETSVVYQRIANFEKEYPEIAKKYFDLKVENVWEKLEEQKQHNNEGE